MNFFWKYKEVFIDFYQDTPFSSILNASICADDPDSGQGGLVNYSLQVIYDWQYKQTYGLLKESI